jgi:Squalene-hopene cyclase C-terminal domain/Prenyltransferase and squalene oxidase repeat
MNSWQKELKVDPVPSLLSLENEAIKYFTMRDLLDKGVESIEILWKLPVAKKILKKQQNDGSWKYTGGKKHIRSQKNYNQLETYRILGELVEKYGFNREHESIQKAAEFLFQFQTEEGDFRGIYGNQYATTYSPTIMELLIKTGYQDDSHIEKGFRWLLSMRQEDGGWIVPIRTSSKTLKQALNESDPIQPDRSKPFSHLVTGMVLRAFAAHPKYRKSDEAKKAGELLISRFFKNDKYPDRQGKNFWERVSFPFWFTDIISALDSLYFLGFNRNNPQIKGALNFLRYKQNENGNFNLKIIRGRDKDLPYWICLAVCRLFKRYYE